MVPAGLPLPPADRQPDLAAPPDDQGRRLRRPGPRQRQPGAAPAACPSRRSGHPGEGTVRPQDRPRQDGRAHHRLLFQGLSRRRRGAADQRRDLAGDALSRNRNWGHPNLVQFLERLSDKAPQTGWRGLLVGDMSQPRGGPMRTGHASHQVGLDADIWLTPMPDRELTREEREEMSATMVVAEDRTDVDPKVWTPAHLKVIKAAAKDPQVARIFVNAAIKKALVPRGRQRPRAGSARCSRGGDTTITSTFA